MSERTFTRKYSDSTGQTPSKMVELLRLEAARHFLATCASPLKTVAQRCGLGNESTFIRSFTRKFSVTPSEYRARFKSRH
ncbi:helix-turn-helix domain-containing protein [Pseudomonas californiensis]|nr:helix-turn-helix domain-containing protein [Pseudomonas californiensis]